MKCYLGLLQMSSMQFQFAGKANFEQSHPVETIKRVSLL